MPNENDPNTQPDPTPPETDGMPPMDDAPPENVDAETLPDEQPQAETPPEEPPPAPLPDARDGEIAELRRQNEYFRQMMERGNQGQQQNQRAPDPEPDFDKLIEELFAPQLAPKVGKIMKQMRSAMEHSNNKRMDALERRFVEQTLESQANTELARIRTDGSFNDDEMNEIAKNAWNSAQQARQRGMHPDLAGSLRAAAYDKMLSRNKTRAQTETAKRAALAKKKAVATAPAGAPPRGKPNQFANGAARKISMEDLVGKINTELAK
jgi:hypothetical protein